jgi:hypothetical protein
MNNVTIIMNKKLKKKKGKGKEKVREKKIV